MHNVDAANALAEFASDTTYEDLPDSVIETCKLVLLDTLGVMIGASTLEPVTGDVVDIVKAGGGKEESSIIAFGGKVPCWMAGFANGAMSHALDYTSNDDRGTSPGGVNVPAVLAMAERASGVDGKQVITALAVSSEVLMRISRAVTGNPMEYGWLSTMQLGIFGATTAACKIMGLNGTQIVDAIGIGLHRAAGTWEMVEGPTATFRAIRYSYVVMDGILAALLAQKGVSAGSSPLEGKNGLYQQYFQGRYDRTFLVDGLGSKFECADMSYKPYPSCRQTHSFIGATLKLVQQHDIAPEDVSEIRLMADPKQARLCFPVEERSQPQTSMGAKISLPFTVALAIAHRKVELPDFTDSRLKDPLVLDLAHRVVSHVRESSASPEPEVVQILTKQGQTLEAELTLPYGSPENPMSKDDLIRKFEDCAAFSAKMLPKSAVQFVTNYVTSLEDQGEVSELVRCIS
ncbi:MAG: MmgE/PrpD family protein [Dehalococcoidia bacterium]|nr:MmgE/PrpD family protein [Dehalococcoidia bacterium]